MLQACLNGARQKIEHSAVPVTAEELSVDAVRAITAGAEELHIHPRADDGAESLEPVHVEAALKAIRSHLPDVKIGLSTREQIRPDRHRAFDQIRSWKARPDYVSVNLIEADAGDLIVLMVELGIGVEAGLWSVADAKRFIALPTAARCLRVL